MSKPSTMHALVLRADGNENVDRPISATLDDARPFLELAELPMPKPGPGQVLVKVRRAGVNPSDIAFIQGYYGQPRIKGDPAGFEGVGKVVGGNGLYARMLVGRDVSFAVVPGGSGAWAGYACTDAAAAIPLIKDVRDEDAAAMIVNPLTAAAMVDMVPARGAFVATAAASQLGKLMASLSNDQGKRMIGLVRRDDARERVQALGAALVLNETDTDFEAQLKQAVQEYRPRIMLDAVAGGNPGTIFDAMGDHSRWVIYGRLSLQATRIVRPEQLIFQHKKIEGFWLTTWLTRSPLPTKLKTIRAVQKRFRDGQWQTDVNATLPLNEAIDGLPGALGQPDGKVQIAV